MITINELIATLEEKIGKEARIIYHDRHPADMLTSQADNGKAIRMLDWNPKVSLDQGLGRLIAWYQQEQSWAKGIDTG